MLKLELKYHEVEDLKPYGGKLFLVDTGMGLEQRFLSEDGSYFANVKPHHTGITYKSDTVRCVYLGSKKEMYENYLQ